MPRTGLARAMLWLLAVLAPVGSALGDVAAAANETASTAPRPVSIEFLSAEEARAAIVDDSLEPYFDLLQPMEMSAKTGAAITGETLEEQRAECRRRYQAGVREFTAEEEGAIRSCVEALLPGLREHYPLFSRMPWRFLKTSNRIECGLAHTRGRHIVLSERMCQHLIRLRRSSLERAVSIGAEILAHEQMHVFQRTHGGLFDSLYTGVWGFVRAKSIERCPWLVEHSLANPDGTDCGWVFPIRTQQGTTYLWPLVVLAEGEGLKAIPRDIRQIAVELEQTAQGFRPKVGQDGRCAFRGLSSVTEYRKALPLKSSNYHPHEASAALFAAIVVLDAFFPEEEVRPGTKRSAAEKVLAPMRTWFRQNLKEGPAGRVETEPRPGGP